MRLSGSYFHVYVFAAFSIGFAVAIANDPVAFERKLQPVVRDAVAMTEAVEDYVHNSRLGAMADETLDLFTKTVRLPTLLLESVSDALENARKRQARRVRYQEEPSRPARIKPAEISQI
jgi:hypothetical protein